MISDLNYCNIQDLRKFIQAIELTTYLRRTIYSRIKPNFWLIELLSRLFVLIVIMYVRFLEILTTSNSTEYIILDNRYEISKYKIQILYSQFDKYDIIKYQHVNRRITWYHSDLLDHIWDFHHWFTRDNNMILVTNRRSYEIRELFLLRNDHNDAFDAAQISLEKSILIRSSNYESADFASLENKVCLIEDDLKIR